MPLRLGALAEPLTSGIRSINRAVGAGGFRWGDTVVIQGSGPDRHPGDRRGSGNGGRPRDLRRRTRRAAPQARPQVRRGGDRQYRGVQDVGRAHPPRARHRRRLWRGPRGRLLGHPSAAPRGSSSCATAAPSWKWGSSHDAGSITTNWHRICTKDLNVLGSWAFTANDLALGVQMLDKTRNKYPWLEMQTLYPFTEDGVTRAVEDAMAMRTVKSTIIPWPELVE